ncbi:hypothetical protein ACFPT7_02470 [Acidicapsa dinghuensis]|uniref:Glycosyltransferase RgtA/B/C/D-like domain-containing protein n=1 Tax=Acidicapsa dinghuensis TaxID=2218256 RepID=A0ABW1EA76_9BACT|nr:hypothetical protein [Acidicapsa dinghuensis]
MFLSAQNGEFKFFFLHAVALVQFYLSRHVDFRILCDIACGVTLLLAVPLWRMFLPRTENLGLRLALFAPVSWLVFQLQYAEMLDFATPQLQHIAGLVFSLSALSLLVQNERAAFCGALACFVLAVSADGNGMFLVIIGLLVLALARRFAHMAAWIAVSATCVAAYAYRYQLWQPSTHPHQSIFTAVLAFRPEHFLAFIGGVASFPFGFHKASIILGLLLCAFFAWLAWKRYWRKNPAVCSCILFLIVTAAGVGGLRSITIHSLFGPPVYICVVRAGGGIRGA